VVAGESGDPTANSSPEQWHCPTDAQWFDKTA
jgi:hypothetical protein